jgi:hypothetical protein
MPNAGKTAHHPKQMKSGDNAIMGTGPAVVSSDDDLSSLQVMSADAQSRARQNAFSLVYVGKFASSSCAYRTKKYFMLSRGTSHRPAYTLSGTPKWIATDRSNPYQNEWETLMKAIRNNTPYNEVKRGVQASVATSMGRMAAHTGQVITFDQMLNCEHSFAPNVDKLTSTSDSPLMPDATGKYPVPQPGILIDREY